MSTASTMTFSEGYTITHNDEIEFLFLANSDTQVSDAVQHELFQWHGCNDTYVDDNEVQHNLTETLNFYVNIKSQLVPMLIFPTLKEI
ncbi:MAG: hypothetical protein CM15mP101_06720 [Flavobacteriaceae bacterium]|nr:MAG: hypothetical protein CM15mP101_06720 [Flavobacteriaceae bacterium]